MVRAAVPAEAGLELTGSPVRVSMLWPVCGLVAFGVLAAARPESHMVGAVAEKTVRPWRSLAVMSPAVSLARVTPVALVDRFRSVSAGFAAAVAFLTTSTSLNPPVSCAVTARSTSGSTLW